MPVRFAITVDTEEDSWFDGGAAAPTVENIYRIRSVQELFDHFGAVPTYLLTYPVVSDDRAVRIIEEIHEKGRCEIGTHCHPWNTPPLDEEPSRFNSFLCNLPSTLQYRKIEILHGAIRNRLGVNPVGFRAGRWGFDEGVAQCIHELGYAVDTSITPYWDWSRDGGPDFSDAPILPYRFDADDVLSERPLGCLAEVPPTIGFLQNDFGRCARVRSAITRGPIARTHIMGALDRLRVLNFRWLTPEICSGSDMVSLAEAFVKNGAGALNMTFHSVSLLPGRSEFTRTEDDSQAFLRKIETILRFAAENGMTFARLSETAAPAREPLDSGGNRSHGSTNE